MIERVISLDHAQRACGVEPIYTLKHLATMTDTSLTFLEHVASRAVDPYRLVEIKKRDGRSVRKIAVPSAEMMSVQRWLLRNVFENMEVHSSAFAYVPRRSAVKAAGVHLGATWLLKLDVRDFFHQFDERQVYWLLRRHAYSRLVALEIARIVTRHVTSEQPWLPQKYSDAAVGMARRNVPAGDLADVVFGTDSSLETSWLPHAQGSRLGYIPQGAPTSGAISNLLMYRTDEILAEFALSHQISYTRYADDVVLSSCGPYSRDRAEGLLRKGSAILRHAGLEPNPTKSKIVHPGLSLEVLGVRVDGERVRLGRRTRGKLDYHVRGIEKFGAVEHARHAQFDDVLGVLAYVHGLVRYAFDVEPDRAESYLRRLPAPLTGA